MIGLKEDLVRASTVARLDALVRLIRAGRGLSGWKDDERRWFAELLYPFSEQGASGDCRLMPSPRVSPFEGGILLEVFTDRIAKTVKSIDDLKHKFDSLMNLHKTLAGTEALDDADQKQMLELATMLRSHMLDRVPKTAAQGDGVRTGIAVL